MRKLEQVNIINNDSHESINKNKLIDFLNDDDESIVNKGYSKFEVEDDSKTEENLIQDKNVWSLFRSLSYWGYTIFIKLRQVISNSHPIYGKVNMI